MTGGPGGGPISSSSEDMDSSDRSGNIARFNSLRAGGERPGDDSGDNDEDFSDDSSSCCVLSGDEIGLNLLGGLCRIRGKKNTT